LDHHWHKLNDEGPTLVQTVKSQFSLPLRSFLHPTARFGLRGCWLVAGTYFSSLYFTRRQGSTGMKNELSLMTTTKEKPMTVDESADPRRRRAGADGTCKNKNHTMANGIAFDLLR